MLVGSSFNSTDMITWRKSLLRHSPQRHLSLAHDREHALPRAEGQFLRRDLDAAHFTTAGRIVEGDAMRSTGDPSTGRVSTHNQKPLPNGCRDFCPSLITRAPSGLKLS